MSSSHCKPIQVNSNRLPTGFSTFAGSALTKIWRVENTGTTWWESYKFKFIGGEQMGGSLEITIPKTAPDETRDISINIVSPSNPGAHSDS